MAAFLEARQQDINTCNNTIQLAPKQPNERTSAWGGGGSREQNSDSWDEQEREKTLSRKKSGGGQLLSRALAGDPGYCHRRNEDRQ